MFEKYCSESFVIMTLLLVVTNTENFRAVTVHFSTKIPTLRVTSSYILYIYKNGGNGSGVLSIRNLVVTNELG